MTDGGDGETWFMRCRGCWEPYVVVEVTMPNGRDGVIWDKPKVKRAAYSCTHSAPPERWNGRGWEEYDEHERATP